MEARLPLLQTATTNSMLGAVMDAKFDIFKRLPDGHPIWVKVVDGLDEARNQLARLAANSPGEYFIYSAQNGGIVQGRIGAGA
jgi:hypothetical protein